MAAYTNILLETYVPDLISWLESQYMKQNSDGDISNFRVSVQSLMKENCHNSRTRDDIHMKLGSVTKPDKRNKLTSKQIDNDVVLTNSDVIVIFLIYSQFGPIRLPDSGRIVCKTYIFMKSNLLSYKTENRTKKYRTQLSHYCFE